jgi:prepilin signal peptidase PulO-like enzyme (type II secretory pathway)
MLGAFLGWQKIIVYFLCRFRDWITGPIVALGFSHRLRQTHRLPFGPFLAVAAVAAILIGDYLIGLYVAHLRAF